MVAEQHYFVSAATQRSSRHRHGRLERCHSSKNVTIENVFNIFCGGWDDARVGIGMGGVEGIPSIEITFIFESSFN